MVNKIPRWLFRFLVVFSLVFPFVNTVAFLHLLDGLPIEHSKLIFEDSEPAITAIVLSNLLLAIGASIGLYKFKSWSRPAAVITTFIGLCVYCFYSYFVDAGFKIAGDTLSTLIAGAVITLAYYSNIAEDFH